MAMVAPFPEGSKYTPNRKAPSQTPGQQRTPHTRRAATASPDAGAKGDAYPGGSARCPPARANARYVSATSGIARLRVWRWIRIGSPTRLAVVGKLWGAEAAVDEFVMIESAPRGRILAYAAFRILSRLNLDQLEKQYRDEGFLQIGSGDVVMHGNTDLLRLHVYNAAFRQPVDTTFGLYPSGIYPATVWLDTVWVACGWEGEPRRRTRRRAALRRGHERRRESAPPRSLID